MISNIPRMIPFSYPHLFEITFRSRPPFFKGFLSHSNSPAGRSSIYATETFAFFLGAGVFYDFLRLSVYFFGDAQQTCKNEKTRYCSKPWEVGVKINC